MSDGGKGEEDEHPCPPQRLSKEALVLRPCLCSADSTGPSHTALDCPDRAAHTHTLPPHTYISGHRQAHRPYSYQLIKLNSIPVFYFFACLWACACVGVCVCVSSLVFASADMEKGIKQTGTLSNYVPYVLPAL